MLRRNFVWLLTAVVAVPGKAGVCAEEPSEWALARGAVERGEILPLAGILAAVEERYEGRVIETELECQRGRWIYEFKLLPPTGRMFMVRVNAANGEFLTTHGPVQERP